MTENEVLDVFVLREELKQKDVVIEQLLKSLKEVSAELEHVDRVRQQSDFEQSEAKARRLSAEIFTLQSQLSRKDAVIQTMDERRATLIAKADARASTAERESKRLADYVCALETENRQLHERLRSYETARIDLEGAFQSAQESVQRQLSDCLAELQVTKDELNAIRTQEFLSNGKRRRLLAMQLDAEPPAREIRATSVTASTSTGSQRILSHVRALLDSCVGVATTSTVGVNAVDAVVDNENDAYAVESFSSRAPTSNALRANRNVPVATQHTVDDATDDLYASPKEVTKIVAGSAATVNGAADNVVDTAEISVDDENDDDEKQWVDESDDNVVDDNHDDLKRDPPCDVFVDLVDSDAESGDANAEIDDDANAEMDDNDAGVAVDAATTNDDVGEGEYSCDDEDDGDAADEEASADLVEQSAKRRGVVTRVDNIDDGSVNDDDGDRSDASSETADESADASNNRQRNDRRDDDESDNQDDDDDEDNDEQRADDGDDESDADDNDD